MICIFIPSNALNSSDRHLCFSDQYLRNCRGLQAVFRHHTNISRVVTGLVTCSLWGWDHECEGREESRCEASASWTNFGRVKRAFGPESQSKEPLIHLMNHRTWFSHVDNGFSHRGRSENSWGSPMNRKWNFSREFSPLICIQSFPTIDVDPQNSCTMSPNPSHFFNHLKCDGARSRALVSVGQGILVEEKRFSHLWKANLRVMQMSIESKSVPRSSSQLDWRNTVVDHTNWCSNENHMKMRSWKEKHLWDLWTFHDFVLFESEYLKCLWHLIQLYFIQMDYMTLWHIFPRNINALNLLWFRLTSIQGPIQFIGIFWIWMFFSSYNRTSCLIASCH
jgi:hypothetical protein